MKLSTLAMGVALLAASGMVVQTANAAKSSAEDDAIRQTAKTFVEAFDNGSAEAVAALWTEDGEYAIGQSSVKGRPAIVKLYEEFFRSHPGSKMTVKIDSIRVLAPTVALEQGTASVENSPNGPPTASTYTAVHVKQGEKWLMASVRESEVPSIQTDQDLKELEWLVGKWSTGRDATKLGLTFEWIADKHFLRGETVVHADDNATPGGTQIIGRNPLTGQIVSWFFNADGGYGAGAWQKDGSRWIIDTDGTAADGTPTLATNVLYHADDNVASWQSVNRVLADMPLPDAPEIVIERVKDDK